MDHLDRGSTHRAGGPGGPTGAAALLHWDELGPEDLGRLERDEGAAPMLARLRAVERYLRRPLDARPCPAAEELYDFANGPGAGPLAAERRAEIEDHVAHCAPCADASASLAIAPPPPLLLEDSTGEDRTLEGRSTGPRPLDPDGSAGPFAAPHDSAATPATPNRRQNWIPLAAAAAVLVAGFGLFRGDGDGSAAAWPTRPLLRHSGQEPLWYPRGPVLADGIALSGGTPTFEFAAVAGAERYRVRVRRHDGSAFADGPVVEEIEGVEPPLRGSVRLAPGHYTWELWARVDGLDDVVGELDFRVVGGGDAARSSSPTLEELRRLHDAGFHTDARGLARTLPPSPERDEYLAPPGR